MAIPPDFVDYHAMHVGMYTETALPKLGGQEMVVDCLARQFLGMGHQVTLLAPYPRLPLRVNDQAFPYRIVRHPRFYSTKRFVSAYRFFLRRFFARYHFDLLHCHGLYPAGYLAALSKDQLNVPIVLTSHGTDVYEKNRRVSNPVLRPRFELAVRSADRLIAISNFTRQGFIRLGASESQLVNIPNGVDLDWLSTPIPKPENLPADLSPGRYFLFMGRLAPRKGVRTILEAVAALGSNFANFRIAVAGDGDERQALHHLSIQLSIEDRVRFLGRVDGEVKAWLLQNALATLMPSRISEAFPLTVLESAAAARPVIASEIPGLVDLVQAGVNGRLIPEGDSAALAAAMREWIADPSAADRAGQAARQWAQDYSWRSVAERHLDVYNHLLRR